MTYPSKISETLNRLQHVGSTGGNAVGSDANFSCGSFVRFYLSINKEKMVVANASFSSNGCGYMLAASELLAEALSGKNLSELHGLDAASLSELIVRTLGEIVKDRNDCIAAAINALRDAFADFRSRQIEEFRGEKALVCTCFGITEESIEEAIHSSNLRTVDEVSSATNAGSGCGSCRMLIQEILDADESSDIGAGFR